MPLPVPKKPPSPSPSSTSRLIVCLLLAVLHQSDQPLPAGCPLEAQLSHLVSHPALCGPLCCPPPPASSSHQRRRPRPPLRPDCLLNHPVSRTGSSAEPPPLAAVSRQCRHEPPLQQALLSSFISACHRRSSHTLSFSHPPHLGFAPWPSHERESVCVLTG